MKMSSFKALAIGVLFFSFYSSTASACEDGHWIQSVSSDGAIIKLEDGSIWEVDSGDAITSMLWLPTTGIVACDDKLINTDDDEKVDANRLK
ncbi:MAG: hypothetical protein PHH91_08850 [Desulfuromonadaceae bacterium]|nr:hypothetical protein [Desulfuromonadaceae bacterium]